MVKAMKSTRPQGQRKQIQQGTTLVEVLISLVVLSIGLLGIAGVNTVSLRNNQASYYRTQATTLAMDISERIRANMVAAEAGNYDNGVAAANANCFTAAGCTAAQMAGQDLFEWSAQVTANLPIGSSVVCLDSTGNDGTAGAVACDGNGRQYAIKIFWDDDRDGVAESRYVATLQPW